MENGGRKKASTTTSKPRAPRKGAKQQQVVVIPPPLGVLGGGEWPNSSNMEAGGVIIQRGGHLPYAIDPSMYSSAPGPIQILPRGSHQQPQQQQHPPHQITSATFLSILPPQLLQPHPQGGGGNVGPIGITTTGLPVYQAVTTTYESAEGSNSGSNNNGGGRRGKQPPLIMPSTVATHGHDELTHQNVTHFMKLQQVGSSNGLQLIAPHPQQGRRSNGHQQTMIAPNPQHLQPHIQHPHAQYHQPPQHHHQQQQQYSHPVNAGGAPCSQQDLAPSPLYSFHHSARGQTAMALATGAGGAGGPMLGASHAHHPLHGASIVGTSTATHTASVITLKEEERKRQKQALNRQSAQRCRKRKRAILEDLKKANKVFSIHAAILEGLCTTNIEFHYRNGMITYVHGIRLLGWDPSQLEGRSIYDFLIPSSKARVQRLLAQLIEDCENTSNEPGSNIQASNGSDGTGSKGSDGTGSDSGGHHTSPTDTSNSGGTGTSSEDSPLSRTGSKSGGSNGEVETSGASDNNIDDGDVVDSNYSETSGEPLSRKTSDDSGNMSRNSASPPRLISSTTPAIISTGSAPTASVSSVQPSPTTSAAVPPPTAAAVTAASGLASLKLTPPSSDGAGSDANRSAPGGSGPSNSASTKGGAGGSSSHNINKKTATQAAAAAGIGGGKDWPLMSAVDSSERSTSNSSASNKFTSREPGSSTNSNISQLLPLGHPASNEFTYQISNLEFISCNGEIMRGDVNGIISLDQGVPEPGCIWSIRFNDGMDGLQGGCSTSTHRKPTSSRRKGSRSSAGAGGGRDGSVSSQDDDGVNGSSTGSSSSGSGESGHSSSSDDAPSPPVAPGTTHGSARPPAPMYSGSAGGGLGEWPSHSNSNDSPPRSEDSNDPMEVADGDNDSE